MAVLPKTSCAFAMSGTIKLWKPEDISEHNILFLETNFKFPSLQVVTICSWRNCVCCFQDVATPISICQQSYFAYMLYHRRKPLNSKYAINSKTQACFLFLGTKEQIPRSSLDFSSQYLFRLVNFTQFHSISISSLCGHLHSTTPPIEYSRLSFLTLKSNLKSIIKL